MTIQMKTNRAIGFGRGVFRFRNCQICIIALLSNNKPVIHLERLISIDYVVRTALF